MSVVTIPKKEREEWEKMITGEINHTFRNYVLQLKIHQARLDVKANKLSLADAKQSIYELCEKYAMAVQSDLRTIFKKW